jgi:hypothetical protein
MSTKSTKGTKSSADTKDHPYEIGRNYFIRTVTHHMTGRLVEVYEHELVLVDAAWIADDGRFADAVKTGVFCEVEPFPDGAREIVGRGSLCDCVAVDWKLPRTQK